MPSITQKCYKHDTYFCRKSSCAWFDTTKAATENSGGQVISLIACSTPNMTQAENIFHWNWFEIERHSSSNPNWFLSFRYYRWVGAVLLSKEECVQKLTFYRITKQADECVSVSAMINVICMQRMWKFKGFFFSSELY